MDWWDVRVGEAELTKYLRMLKPDKSPGIDGLMPTLLRETSEQISYPLAKIFNR